MDLKSFLRRNSRASARAPKSGHTFSENLVSQPLVRHRTFHRHDVITEGWYPLCRSSLLSVARARSVTVGQQRLVIFRGQDGRVRALDAFCPHMGADLSNGTVVENDIQCYFHQWRFNERGACVSTRCGKKPSSGARIQSYSVDEKWGHIWVYAGGEAEYPLPLPPGLDGCDVNAWHLGRVRLYAHHHAMMAGGIDLQHFGSVHGLDADFDVEHTQTHPHQAEWFVRGRLPAQGSFRQRLGGALLGRTFGYRMRVAGGSVVAMTYGDAPRLFGSGLSLPTLHILWGCLPQKDGVSEVEIFVLAQRGEKALGHCLSASKKLMTLLLLGALRDDDVKAFPNMRFQPRNLLREDAPVVQLIQYLNAQPVTEWSQRAAWEEEVARENKASDARSGGVSRSLPLYSEGVVE